MVAGLNGVPHALEEVPERRDALGECYRQSVSHRRPGRPDAVPLDA